MTEKKLKTYRQVAMAAFLILLAALFIGGFIFLRARGLLHIFYDQDALREFIAGFGAWAPVIFCLVQVFQVVVSLIPGNVTTLIGGALFGFWPGFFLSAVSIAAGSILCFLLARALGRPLVRRLVSEKTFDRYFSTLSARPTIAAALMMLLPFFPDDLICLLLGITGMKFSTFLLVIVTLRPWGLIVSSLIGSGVIGLPMGALVVIGVLSLGVGAIALRYGPQFEEWIMAKIARVREKRAGVGQSAVPSEQPDAPPKAEETTEQ
ncbi:TVP38/TMEM64 family protein [Oscillospiraceae bacterium OttesenSCG-928-G22]|nr:TVP38/TMEM64 family protein [Oscillospiraceae bacterium OttesenSCG-928-G22]